MDQELQDEKQDPLHGESADETIRRVFRTLRREEKERFLTCFENALKTQSSPVSGCRPRD